MKNQNQKREEKQSLLFNKKKYLILIFSVFLLFIGFLLLSGGGASDSTFNPEIFSIRRIVIAPIVIIIAFIISGFSIMIKK